MVETNKKGVRLNTEKSIDHKTFKLKIGSTNRENPEVIYFNGRAFITPNKEKESYTKELHTIKRGFQNKINNLVCNNSYFTNKYILDFEVSNTSIRKGKKSFLSFEFLVRQPNSNILNLKDFKKNTQDDFIEVIDYLENSIIDQDFSVTKGRG